MRFFFLFLPALITIGTCDDVSFEKVAIVQSKKIDENSGIDLSYKYPGAVWTHNDSGGKPRLFLVSLESGNTMATVEIEGSINRDWEDIATFQKNGKSFIVVGDIGDNYRRRKEYQLCILEEPQINPGETEVLTVANWLDYRYHYEDAPKNCESIAVDLENNRFILIEKIYPKVRTISGVYSLEIPENGKSDGIAKRIANLKSKNFSAMDISDDGTALMARAYHQGYLYRRNKNQTWAEILGGETPQPIEFPIQRQGEGVCFTPDGKSVLISTEKKKQPIFKVVLPFPAH